MAFVRAAVALNNTSFSGISAFFYPRPMLLSGVDYYTEKEGINVGENTLYIENTSPRLPQIGFISAPSRFAQKNVLLRYCDFSLFINLSSLDMPWQNNILTIDLRANPNFNQLTNFATSLTGLFIVGSPIQKFDIRDSQLTFLNISGCQILGNVNLDNAKLSAVSFRDGTIRSLNISRNPFKLFDFSECDTRFLSSLAFLDFSPTNQFSPRAPVLSAFNFTGPLSSILFINCENNYLTSFSLANLPTLEQLYLGHNFNKASNISIYNAITSIDLINLHNLKTLDISFNTISSINLDSSLLSALQVLKAQGTSPFRPGFKDLNTQLFNLSSQTNLRSLFLNDNNLLGEINFLDYPVNFKDTLLNLSAYNCASLSSVEITPLRSLQKLNLANCLSLSSLNAFSLTALDTLDLTSTSVTQLTAPIIPNNLRNLLIGVISSFNFPTLNNLNQLTLGTGLSAATFTTLSALSSLTIGGTNLKNVSLEGLSSLQIVRFSNNRLLSSITTINLNLPVLTNFTIDSSSVGINAYASLSTLVLTGFNNLQNVTLTRQPFTRLQVDNNAALINLNIDQNLSNTAGIPQPNLQPTLTFDNLPALRNFRLIGDPGRQNSVPREIYFTNSPLLCTFTLYTYPQLSASNFLNSSSLTRVDVQYVGFQGQVNFNALPVLEYINFSFTSASQAFFTNLPALSTLQAQFGILSSVAITNCPELRTLSFIGQKLSSLALKDYTKLLSLQINGNKLRNTHTFNTNLTSVVDLRVATNSLTSINLSSFVLLNDLYAFSNKLSTVDLSNNYRLKTVYLNNNNLHGSLNITSLTGVENLFLYANNLTAVNASNFNLLNQLQVHYNLLAQENIDTLMIQACAGGTAYLYDYSFNPTGRSSFSNAAYTHLNNNGAILIPNEPNNTVSQPKPTLTIVSPALPATLAYTQTLALSATAYYVGNSVPTFYSVLSGPGVTLSPTVSALSGTGTITVLVSTLSTTVFAPTSALFDITLTKLDISSFIQFSNTGSVYDGSAKSVSAFSVTPPGLNIVTYYLSSGFIVTPVDVGTYTVSAIVTDANYAGSASTTMNIYPAGFYILPAGAKSSLIYSTSGFDTRKDIVMTFDYAFYGTTTQAGEGFCVSFVGYTNIVSGGAPGYGLNYTNASFLSSNSAGDAAFNNYNGLYSGILGIGFDNTGNFGTSSYGVTGLPNAVPNSIALRGGFYDNYQVINRTNSLSSYDKSFSIYQQVTGANTPVYRRVRVRLADLGKRIIVQHKELSASDFNTYMDYYIDNLTPTALRPCLSYSSGLTAATFKVKNFNINGYFNNNYNEPVEPGTFDISIQIPVSGGPAGSSGVSFVSLYQNDIISYDRLLPTDLPESMDIYINNNFVANVLFDPVYTGRKFQYYRFSTLTNYEGVFAPGSVAVL